MSINRVRLRTSAAVICAAMLGGWLLGSTALGGDFFVATNGRDSWS